MMKFKQKHMKDVEYKYMRERFLPICRQDMKDRGSGFCRFCLYYGDAYVDHPSFGPAVITRKLLESRGYRIGIISSRTGKIRRVSRYTESQDLLSGVCRQYGFYGESLFRFPKSAEKQMHTPLAASWENVRIMQQ